MWLLREAPVFDREDWEELRSEFMGAQERCLAALARLTEEDLDEAGFTDPFGQPVTRGEFPAFLATHRSATRGSSACSAVWRSGWRDQGTGRAGRRGLSARTSIPRPRRRGHITAQDASQSPSPSTLNPVGKSRVVPAAGNALAWERAVPLAEPPVP